ncbi:MAG: hypothetical protein ACREJB_10280 [Planctomycetaceae bacterium]
MSTSHAKNRTSGLRVGLIVFLVVGLCFLLLGFWRGWFALSADSENAPGPNETDITFTVDEGQIKQDAGAVTDDLKEARQTVEAVAETESVEGTLTRVDADARVIEVQDADDETLSLRLNEASVIEINGKEARVDQLHENDAAMVTYQSNEKGRWVEEIDVTRP